MSALDIQPHSRHGSTLAVALLSLFAVGAFVAGLNNQLIGPRGLPPSIPVAGAAVAPHATDAIPDAKPTPDTQLADAAAAAAAARRAARPVPALEEAAPADVAPPAAASPAVEAAASAPAPEPTPPAPPPAPVPENAEPPT